MKKRVAALTMAAVMTMSVIGCAPTAENAPVQKADAGADGAAPVSSQTDGGDASAAGGYGAIKLGETGTDITTTIKFIHHKTDREQDGTIAGYIAEFNKTYPNITVETEGITDYAEDALLRLQGGNWGDVMFIPAIDKAELANYYEPFGTVDEMDGYINFASTWASDNMTYGIAYMGNAQGILYNKKVFADAGVTRRSKTIRMRSLCIPTLQPAGPWAHGMHIWAPSPPVMIPGITRNSYIPQSRLRITVTVPAHMHCTRSSTMQPHRA